VKVGASTSATEALDVAGNILASGSITAENLIVGSTNVITEITALQSLTATHTEDLATNTADILTKQATITSSTDLETNSIFIEENLNLKKTTYFDTIVIRRFNEADTTIINLNELQIWVNGSNILFPNSAILTSYFALWSNKEVALATYENNPVSKIYNNIIESGIGAHSLEGTNALIIKNIPLTSINEIQSIVLYNRNIAAAPERVIGLFLELYNSTNDPDLTEVLVTTNVITSHVVRYRYDFPSLSTYTGSFATADSTTNIVSNSIASTEEANVISFSTELTGDLVANINTTLADILSRLELLENP
jgi:hypothetical protein